MVITEKMVRAMMVDLAADQVAIELPKRIAHIHKIRNQLAVNQQKLEELRNIYNKQLAELQAEAEKIRETCPHYILDFHADHAGGGASYHDCSVCGKIV